MSVRRIINTFSQWQARREPMVLVTVYETLGSTYSKPGQRMLISGRGEYQGLISGGCLEADLVEHALRVLDGGVPAPVTYDLRDEAEDIFGLGIGCDGVIRVLLQPLLPEHDYAPMQTLSRLFEGRNPVSIVTVVSCEDKTILPGATWWHNQTGELIRIDRNLEVQANQSSAESLVRKVIQSPGCGLVRDSNGNEILSTRLRPIPRLLILGAGLDAVPVIRIASELGWITGIVDHRPAYLERGDLETADMKALVDPRKLSELIGAGEYDAAVVMSHHLDTDASYLRALAKMPLLYLGVLGPPARREKLLKRLSAEAPTLTDRLRGPLGINIGGGSPEAIALSIVAELQAVFSSADRDQ